MISKFSNRNFLRLIQNTPQSRSIFFSTSLTTAVALSAAHIGTVVPPSPVMMKSTWNEVGRIRSDTRITWNDRKSVVSQKQFRYVDYGHVTKQRAFAFESVKRLSAFKQIRFNTLAQARCFSTSRYNTLFKLVVRDWVLQSASPGFVTTGIVHPIDFRYSSARSTYFGLTRSTVYPIDYQSNTTIGQTPVAGIQWRTGINPSGRVACTKASAFNDLNTTIARKAFAFGIDERYARTQAMRFNVYNKVTKTMTSTWIVGPRIPGHIRQMAQVRTDFAY